MSQRSQAVMVKRDFAAYLAFNGTAASQLTALFIFQYEKVVAPVDGCTLGKSRCCRGDFVV